MADAISIERRRNFVAKLLAPLPEAAEPVETKEIQSETKAAIKDRFWLARFKAEKAWHLLKAANVDGILVRVGKTEASWSRSTNAEIEAAKEFVAAMNEMMRVPAVTRQMLADKQVAFRKWGVSYIIHTAEMGKAARARWQQYLDEDIARLAEHTGKAVPRG